MLVCFTSSHQSAGFELLERLERRADDVSRALAETPTLRGGRVVLATCNRFEAYLDVTDPPTDASRAVLEAIAAAAGVPADDLRAAGQLLTGHPVAEHLFAVSAGLESMVVGEGEIAGQVRRALEAARAAGSTTSELERLFQRASQTSRGVKNRTGIGKAGRSLVRLSLDLAESRVTDWANTRVLLVGTGRYAGASLAALRERGVTDVRVFSRTGRGERFAASHDIVHVDADAFAREAALASVVVTCTTTPDFVLDAGIINRGRCELAAPLAAERALPGDRTLTALSAEHAAPRQLVIDLGLPRNVDPDVQTVEGVELLDLETIRIHAPLDELKASEEARALVGKAARKFADVAAEQSLAPAVVALRSHVFDVLDAEIDRARARGDENGHTEQALRHFAGVLLHTPMVRSREYARSGEQDAFVDGLRALFGVELDGDGLDATPDLEPGSTREFALPEEA